MKLRTLLVGSMLAIAAASHADITFYDFFRTGTFTQTSDSQPVTPNTNGFFWNARIFSNTVGDFVDGSFTDGNGNTNTMTLDSSQTILSYGQGGYASDSAMVPSFMPQGGGPANFTYAFSGGTLGTQSATLTEPETPLFPDQVPYLTNSGFSALQNVLPGQSVNLSWNAFTSNATFQITFFTIYDYTTNAYVLNNSGLANTYTGDTLNGANVIAGHQYQYNLYFSSRNSQTNAGFGTGTASEGYDYVTSGSFTVVPEPASIAALGFGLALLVRRRKTK